MRFPVGGFLSGKGPPPAFSAANRLRAQIDAGSSTTLLRHDSSHGWGQILPIVAGIGSLLPALFSSGLLAALVLGLPTLDPLFYEAVRSQDIYLASSYLMIITVLLVIGNIVADILLAWLDPRIRLQ